MFKYASFIIIFLIFQSCAIPRCKDHFCNVSMVHFHQGNEYRGVSLYQWYFGIRNPRYGEEHPKLVKDKAIKRKGDKNGFVYKVKGHDNKTVIRPAKEEIIDSTKLKKPQGPRIIEDSVATEKSSKGK